MLTLDAPNINTAMIAEEQEPREKTRNPIEIMLCAASALSFFYSVKEKLGLSDKEALERLKEGSYYPVIISARKDYSNARNLALEESCNLDLLPYELPFTSSGIKKVFDEMDNTFNYWFKGR
jgi:hypothetical protein